MRFGSGNLFHGKPFSAITSVSNSPYFLKARYLLMDMKGLVMYPNG